MGMHYEQQSYSHSRFRMHTARHVTIFDPLRLKLRHTAVDPTCFEHKRWGTACIFHVVFILTFCNENVGRFMTSRYTTYSEE
jgi:hypothetical protein